MGFNPNSEATKEFHKRLKERATTQKAAVLSLMAEYRKKAKRRNLDWLLTEEQCTTLFTNNCFYCKTEPLLEYKTKYGAELLYNGIDRRDNAIGYKSENAVSCCKYCNLAKYKSSEADLRAWLADIAAYYPTLLKKEAAIAI